MELINIPMYLTLIRLVVSPLFLPVFIVYLLPYNITWLNSGIALLFILLSITDFFDGYLARRYNQVTVLGRVLDPLADKFLTYSALIGLLAADKIYFYWVVILIGREMFVMGIRHVALEHNFSVPVSALGKLKTALQMVTITVLILNPYHYDASMLNYWNSVALILLIVTTFLSVMSAQRYYEAFMVQLRAHREQLVIDLGERE